MIIYNDRLADNIVWFSLGFREKISRAVLLLKKSSGLYSAVSIYIVHPMGGGDFLEWKYKDKKGGHTYYTYKRS